MRTVEKEQSYKAVTFFEGEEPIGCADIEIIGDEIWLNHLAVREDYRGKGYGQKIVLAAIAQYKVNTLTCAVKNTTAFHIYNKHGFEIVEVVNSFDDGEVFLMKRNNR